MFDVWIKGWRRRRLVNRPVPTGWSETLTQCLWYWRVLSEAQRMRLLKLVGIFLAEKELVTPQGFADVELVRVTIAANACLLLLGFDDWYCFDRIKTVIVTQRPTRQRIPVEQLQGFYEEVLASGTYTRGAPLTLSWHDVERDSAHPARGRNVVIHEFAHHIDDLDGALAGDPPFASRELRVRWRGEAEAAQKQLAHRTSLGLPTVLDAYGLANEVEFFAVACEAYFCRPHELAAEYPQLFALLLELFRLDTRGWFTG